MILKISVIIPIYNLNSSESLSYFNDLIISIVSNISDDTNFKIHEAIIVDDSPTETNRKEVDLILSQIKKFCSVNYLVNSINRGQAFSRNLGASVSTGDIFHFIDQDDMISSKFYENLLFDNENFDLMMSDCVHLSRSSRSFYRFITKFMFKRAISFYQLRLFLINNIANSPGQYLIKKGFFSDVSGFPILEHNGSDDFGIFLRYIKIKHKFLFVEKAKFLYRTHKYQSSNVLNMRLSEREAFNEHYYSMLDIMFWVKQIKLNFLLSPFRILMYKLFYASFK
jgi:glycosyltransferase involved in cell wall biosynthesis